MNSISLSLRADIVTISATNRFGMNSTQQITGGGDGAASMLVLTNEENRVTAVLHGQTGEKLTTNFPKFTVAAHDLIRCANDAGWYGVCKCLNL